MRPDDTHMGNPVGERASPSISIVVPAYNRAKYISETLRSISAQTFEDWECVVVDDGSSDDTFEVSAEHARVDPRIRSYRTTNAGPSAARNFGFLQTNSHTEFVTFMDSDDVWLPDALETLHAAALGDPLGAGSHGLAEMIDGDGKPVRPGWYAEKGRGRLGVRGREFVTWPLDEPTDFAVLVNGNVLFPPGLVLARRSAYEAVGRFDEAFRGPEDWDMLIRISRRGNLRFVNRVILLYRMHGENLGSGHEIAREAWLVRCKAFHSPENSVQQTLMARRGWRAYQRGMIITRLREFRDAAGERRLRSALDRLVRVSVHVFRFARGYPTPKLVRTGPFWDD